MGKNDNGNSGIDAKTQLRRHFHAKRMGVAKARFESDVVQKMMKDRLDEAFSFAERFPSNTIDAEIGIVSADGEFTPSTKSFSVDTTQSSTPVSKRALAKAVDKSSPATQSQQLSPDYQLHDFTLHGALPSPWDMRMLKGLTITNVVHAAAIETKAADYAYSGWHLELRPEVALAVEEKRLTEETVQIAEEFVSTFLETCFGDNLPVEDMCRDMALEYEGLGISAFEVIRQRDGLLHNLKPMSFVNLRFLNKKIVDTTTAKLIQIQGNDRRYFVKFGDSVLYDGESDPGPKIEVEHKFNPFTAPYEDFPEFNKRDSFIRLRENHVNVFDPNKSVKPGTKEAATELFILPRRPFTLSQLYGTPAGIQAQASLLALKRIEEYNLQFFTAKGVPQYAIIVKGLSLPAPTISGKSGNAQNDASAATKVRETIMEFFTNKLVAANRSVLVLTAYGNTQVEFQKLSSESIEGSFAEYEKRMTESIRMSHGVPPAALGIAETANLGGGRDTAQLKRYRDHIIIPGQRQFANVVNQIIRGGLLVPYFNFVFDPVDINEEEGLRKFNLEAYIAGAISPDEFRARVPGGFSAIGEDSGGDALYIRAKEIFVVNPKPIDGEDMERALQLTIDKEKQRIQDVVNDALQDETIEGNGHDVLDGLSAMESELD